MVRRVAASLLLCLLSSAAGSSGAARGAVASNVTWHVVWVGGQSNSVGTNSQTTGYPVWPSTPMIQMFCWKAEQGCTPGTFAPAKYPVYNEANVGFSLTFANLLLQALPANDGVVLINTGVGGTGFQDGQWVVPNGPLAVQSVSAVTALHAALPTALGGNYSFHSMLWHQGEEDAGDNRVAYHADYCTYLVNDLSALIDFLRAGFPGAGPSTPFVSGGLLPYWIDAVNGTEGVTSALYALNTSRACTATADSRIFPDFLPDGTPYGDPKYRSGASGDVIHFTATQATFLGFEYWRAYGRALGLTGVVPSSQTGSCPGSNVQPSVTACGA
jgi:hypothetical protein